MTGTTADTVDPGLPDLARRLCDGDRTALARAITLVESRRGPDRLLAESLLDLVWPGAPRRTLRLAITGPPGAGKSTLIEKLGSSLLEEGHRVAVLAVDPSSTRSGGSILGDKTRMPTLSTHASAYIRPSPTGGELGGVARTTREAIVLCESAGYDVVLVETVGVGQSEIQVDDMVDYVLLVLIPGGGDELQGIKRGILEIADLFAVNKADLGNDAALNARGVYRSAVSLMAPRFADWRPPVVTCSAITGDGIPELAASVRQLDDSATASGQKAERRGHQRISWFHNALHEIMLARLRAANGDEEIVAAEHQAASGGRSPARIARSLVESGLEESERK